MVYVIGDHHDQQGQQQQVRRQQDDINLPTRTPTHTSQHPLTQ